MTATATATQDSSSSPTSPPAPLTYKKRLEGVESTPELQKLLQQALDKTTTASSSNNDTHESTTILQDYLQQSTPKCTNIIPFPVLRAAATMVNLDPALSRTHLAYTQPPPFDPARQAYVQRLERLRLQQEERNYSKLTRNVMKHAQPQDDITAKSMTYAASIGLNMIVAPLSFGCFMYFFCGNLFGWNNDNDNTDNQQHNPVYQIRRVMVSVISGVVMLIVEMLLFVIRSHEMDKATRQKQKAQTPQPFGQYTSRTARNYQETPLSSSS